MKTVGIIAEYNPFHNGHAYQIKRAKELTGADYALVIMSGNYVQRGEPAIFDKHLRTQAALTCGADLVMELPVCYSAGSSAYFAEGAVSLLEKLGVCDYLCFGSECGDIARLSAIAELLAEESAEFKHILTFSLSSGDSFPAARRKAVSSLLGEEMAHVLDSPNNILGVEYLISLKKHHSAIQPVTLQRRGNDYRDSYIHSSGDFSSAAALRREIENFGTINTFLSAIPRETFPLYLTRKKPPHPVFADDLSRYLSKALTDAALSKDALKELSCIHDIDDALAHRIAAKARDCVSFTRFAELLHTKDTTRSHVNRSLLHLILGLKEDTVQAYRFGGVVFYAKILGFRKDSSAILSKIKEHSCIPIISKYADAANTVKGNPLALSMLRDEAYADNLYRYIIMNRYKTEVPTEEQKGVAIL